MILFRPVKSRQELSEFRKKVDGTYTNRFVRTIMEHGDISEYQAELIKMQNDIQKLYKQAQKQGFADGEVRYGKNVDLYTEAGLDNSAFSNGEKYSLYVDNKNDKRYNINNETNRKAESNVRTNEFRELQKRSRRMSDEEVQLYHSGKRQIDESLRRRFSRSVQSLFMETNDNGVSNADGLLNLSAKGNEFQIYKNVDADVFHNVFEIARNYLKFGELVDLHEVNTTEDGIGYKDCFNYLSKDGLSGFSITKDGDLISVFNASGKAGFLRAISPIVKEKAKTLDCYASESQNLQSMYSAIFSFKSASVMDYNMEYDHDNIAENHNSPQVAFMVNTDADVQTKHFNKDQYDEALEYRNSFIEAGFGADS